MTGLCIILIDAVVARQETQKKGHLVVYKPMCAAEYKRHRRIFRTKDECAIFSICGYSYFYYYCKPLISKPVFLLPRAANDLQTHN